MAYVASLHKASSVRHAVRANFLAPDETSLIVAKSNRVEILSFTEDGLTTRASFTVYGKITSLLTLRPENSRTDHLFIATDRYDYLTVSWDMDRGRPRNEITATDVSDRFLRDTRCGPLYLADPKGRMLLLHVYEGMLLLLPIIQKKGRKAVAADRVGNLDDATAIRIQELNVIDMAFLNVQRNPVLAILHRDSKDVPHIKCYEIVTSNGAPELKDYELPCKVDRSKPIIPMDREPTMIIPIPGGEAGLAVVGEQTVWYSGEGVKPFKIPIYEPGTMKCWGSIDDHRYLLADESGELRLMVMDLEDNGDVGDIKVEVIGKTSVPETLVYLDNGHVFVGSHSGDSQLVRLSPKAATCEVLQTFPNLAPILDFRVQDLSPGSDEQQQQYSSGQMRIITASGGFYNGGLRSLKSGVGLSELATLFDLEDVRSLWCLQADPASEYDDTLVISSVGETQIISFDADGEAEQLEDFKGFPLDEETLLFANIPGGLLLQVRPSGIKVVDAEGGTAIAEVTPEAAITTASVDDGVLVCSVGGTSIVAYDCQDLREIGRRRFEHEVACLTVSSAVSRGQAKVCAVGFWTTSEVSLLSLPELKTLASDGLGGAGSVAVPRSVLLAQVIAGQSPTLLVAMGDGTVYTFAVSKDYTLSHKKSIALATQGVYFHAIPRASGGNVSVFAACDHPSLLYDDEGRISYSAVTSNKVTHIAPFNARAYPSSAVCLAGGELKIAKVDTAREIHIQTFSMGDVVRRVAYMPDRKVHGMVTIERSSEISTGDDIMTCWVRVVDDEGFDLVDSYRLAEDELVESMICARLDNGDGTTGEKFLVGTGYIADEDKEVNKGRLLVFEFSEERKLKLAAEASLKAAVKCIHMVGDKILAALNKTVDTFSYSYPQSPTKPVLTKLASYRAHSEPIDLGVYDNVIAVGDLMKGPLMLQHSEIDGKCALSDLAKTYTTSWTTAVEMLDADTVIAADSEANMSIWRRDAAGITEDDRRKLQLIGEIKIGETVNRIRRVDQNFLTGLPVQPKAYFATVDGSVSLLGEISSSRAEFLQKLQSNLARIVKSPGDLEFNRWRAFSSPQKVSEEPFRFVDGDFLERFLELPQEDAEKVVAGLGKEADALDASVDEVRTLIEGLKRLH